MQHGRREARGVALLVLAAAAPRPVALSPSVSDDVVACACFSVCGMSSVDNGTDACFDATRLCEPTIPRFTPAHGRYSLAVLAHNTVYRVSDILRQRGSRWRLDAITVLCEPRYRSTALRGALVATSKLDSRPMSRVRDDVLEAKLRRRSESSINRTERVGYAKLRDEDGPNGVYLGLPGDSIRAFASELGALRRAGECPAAGDETLVVVVRAGDAQENVTALIERVDAHLSTLRAAGAAVKQLLVSAVAMYANNPLQGFPHVRKRTAYRHRDSGDLASAKAVDEVLEYARERGLKGGVRSVPDADADLCFYAHSSHLVAGARHGFADFVRALRALLHGAPAADEVATLPILHVPPGELLPKSRRRRERRGSVTQREPKLRHLMTLMASKSSNR